MKNERLKRLEDRAEKTKAAAHKRVVKDGTIQFRLDAENISRLLDLADTKKTGAGVLARMWVVERLNKELSLTTRGVHSEKTFADKLSQLQSQMDGLVKTMREINTQ